MRLIALDLDGTLLDCRERQSLLAASLCRAVGFELNVEQFWHAKREGATTALALRGQGADKCFAERLTRLWVGQIEGDAWLRIDRVLAGAISAMHDARKRGFNLHLVTARSREHALRHQLRWLSLEQFFEDVEVVSPQAASQHKARYLSAVRPVAYIGDSESDASAANAAQIRFIAVSSGQRSAEYLQTHTNPSTQPIKSNLHDAMSEILNAEY
jgi:phosphoglycolate phosphatase-like HAD superfamily hydrolase